MCDEVLVRLWHFVQVVYKLSELLCTTLHGGFIVVVQIVKLNATSKS